jgi:hypothetical protein
MKKIMLGLVGILLLIVSVQAQSINPQVSVIMTKYDPFPVEAGNYFTLWVKVQNLGAVDAQNVTLELLDTFPFTIDPNEERVRFFGTVKAGEDLLAQYRVRVEDSAVEGNNPLDVRLSTDGRVFFTTSFDVYVESRLVDFEIGNLASEPENLFSDSENNKLTITLHNVGEGEAKLVKTELRLPSGFIPSSSYSDTYSIGTVGAESSGNAVFYIDIDRSVQSGEHYATLKVSYKDSQNSEYREKVLMVKLPVRASPSFEVTGLVTNPEIIGQGMEGIELKVSIQNTGSREAENVNVRVLKEATQPFDFDEKSNFVGNLDPGESGEAVFRFDADNTADLKKYIMDIEIRYTQDSTVKTVGDKISFSVTERLPDLTGSYVLIILGIAVIAIAVWLVKRK